MFPSLVNDISSSLKPSMSERAVNLWKPGGSLRRSLETEKDAVANPFQFRSTHCDWKYNVGQLT